MYFTTHLLAGAVTGTLAQRLGVDPAVALGFGLVSHAALDCVPHHDYRTAVSGGLDLLTGVAVVVGLSAGPFTHAAIALAALGGVIPDLEVALGHGLAWFGVPERPGVFPSHSGLLHHRNMDLPWGFAIQLGIAALCLAALIPLS